MMTWLVISAVSGAAAFIICMIFMIRTLTAARSSLEQVNQTLTQVRQVLEDSVDPAKQLIASGTSLTEEVRGRIKSLEGLFDSVNQVGAAAGEAAEVLKNATTMATKSISGVQRTAQTHQKRLQDGVEWVTTGIELWHRWQDYKRSKSVFEKKD